MGGANSVSQVDGVSNMASIYCLSGGRAQKRNSGFFQHVCLEESCPPAGPSSSSLYVSEAFQSAAPVLELRGSESK